MSLHRHERDSTLAELFDGEASFDASSGESIEEGIEGLLKNVPARWAVYLMADADGKPVQLLSVKNLRASLKRRLGVAEARGEAVSRRVDYTQLVRKVYYRRVDSRFEADLVYLECARRLFPLRYAEMVGFRPAWFLHVDTEAEFPRFIRTSSLDSPKGVYLGPVETREAAGRLLEQIEDAFDLCRYHSILTQAPQGKACAYKEMHRCPAPCDGSLEMGQYRSMVSHSVKVLLDPQDAMREHEGRMRQAAGELKFELAQRIKQYVDQLSLFAKGPFRHVRMLEHFAFVVLQHGRRFGEAKVFLVSPGQVSEELGLISEPHVGSPVLRLLIEASDKRIARSIDMVGAERVAVVTTHLFATKHATGVIIPVAELDDRTIIRAYRELMKQKQPDLESEDADEGVMKELQSQSQASGSDEVTSEL